MKKLFGLLLALCFLVSAAYAQEMKFVSEFEGGKLYKAGKLNVVVMRGNFHQMGRQYGALLKSELNEFYDLAVKQAKIGTEKAPYDKVLVMMKDSLEKLPFYVREWVRGTGETSGLGADKQIIACQILIPLIMGDEGCSGLMAWGEYTKDGSTVVGRNWDLPGKALEPYQKFLTVAVFNPVGSGQGVADINYAGQIVWQTAMNQSGLFYDLQNGGASDPSAAKNRLNSNSALMSMMLDSTSLQQVDGFFDAVRSEGGLIINVADAKQGFCYEWGTVDYKKRVDDEKGLLAATNHFIDPAWHCAIQIPGGKPAAFTNERCGNLLALGKKYKGQINAHKMMEIFDTTIPNGGPSFHSDSGFKTYYSIVAVPKELKLWLKVRDLQNWIEIDLKPLFEFCFAGQSSQKPLSAFVTDHAPWLHRTANSEQRQPVYLGAVPREFCLGLAPKDQGKAILYDVLRMRGEEQAKDVRNALVKNGAIEKNALIELECWPVRDDFGQLTWAFARWRQGKSQWRWLDTSLVSSAFLPSKMYSSKKEDFHLIFDNVLKLKGLYDKPLFGDCIWTEDGEYGGVFEAWVPVDKMEEYSIKNSYPVCRVLPQPARLNSKPAVFYLSVSADKVIWPRNIGWKKENTALPGSVDSGPRIKVWPKDFISAYKKDVLTFDGERQALFPITKRKVFFKDKTNIDKNNQLQDIVAYLEERYKILGIKTWRQDFTWRGMKQTNLIAVIPGLEPKARPVLMADHIDTAFCEDIYEATGKRVSAPGADDNYSATAVLLRAAELLKDTKPRHDIWLVHLTGEEFPQDDLGAAYFVNQLLKDKQDIEGLVLVDMIGHRENNTMIFQINPGDSEASLRLAKAVLLASKRITKFQPALRTRFDEKSYLYNTDGLIFAEAGFPVVYLNEHMNKLENMYRKGYHHSTDTGKKIDWNYATDIAKIAIETTALLADAH